MPTTSWILESAQDRYNEGMHLQGWVHLPHAEVRVTKQCPFCPRTFTQAIDEATIRWARHIGRDHPLGLPVLIVNGRILSANTMLARLPHPERILVENATRIEVAVDGGTLHQVAFAQLNELLVGKAKRVLQVRLVNERIEDRASSMADLRIIVDVPDPAALQAVDEAFLHHLARDDVSLDDARRFAAETDGSANHYRDGLASYIYGILAKDSPTSKATRHRLEWAMDCLGKASHYLAQYQDRAVAVAVRACARINLNDFEGIATDSGIVAVDTVAGFLSELAYAGASPSWPLRPAGVAAQRRCPIDSTTLDILEMVFALGESNPGRVALDQLERMERDSLAPSDRTKLAVIVGEWANGCAMADVVKSCAMLLFHDPTFGRAVGRWNVP